MPNTAYFNIAYPNSLDPAYADIWGDILNTVFNTFDSIEGREQFSSVIVSPGNTTYTLLHYSRWPGTIKSLRLKTDAGTVTANVKIDSTSVTSLSAVAATSTSTNTSATALNTFIAGQDISITLSALSGVTTLLYNLTIDRTGAGNA